MFNLFKSFSHDIEDEQYERPKINQTKITVLKEAGDGDNDERMNE